MRSSVLASPTLLKLASLSLVLGSAGCSLVYDGSRFQGGTTSDTGTVDAAGTDAGAPDDAEVDAHVVVRDDGGGDDAAVECTMDSECAAASYCATGVCVECDGDGDGFFADTAPPVRCGAGALVAGDCDDTNAAVSPAARPDCATPEAEACPLPFMLPADVTVTELGLSPEHVLFRTGATRLASGRIGLAIGDDAPRSTDGRTGGVVLLHAEGAGMRSVVTVPWSLGGGGASFNIVAGDFDVSDFAFGRYVESPSSLHFGLLAVGGAGQATYSFHTFDTLDNLAFFAPTSLPATSTFYGPDGGARQTAAAIADSSASGGGVAILGPAGTGMTGTPTLATLAPSVGTVTGGANVRVGTWLAGEGAGLMWVADDSHVGIWNGTESEVSPPLVDLSAYVGGTPFRAVSIEHRGALAVSRSPGREEFLGAVVIADTTTTPGGTIILLRWSYGRPTAPTTRTSDTIPSGVRITQLTVAPGFDPRGGVALVTLGNIALLAHLEGRDIVVRPLPIAPPPGGTDEEDAARVAMLRLEAGQRLRGVALDTGLYAAERIARVGIVAVLGDATADEVHTRAVEACIAP